MRSHRLPLLLTFVFAGPLAALELHVATDGNDAWSGKLSSPSAKKSDGPFATFERARDAIARGAAAQKLAEFVQATQRLAATQS